MLNKEGKLILSGRAVWPALNEPDEYKGKKNYKVSISMSAEKAAPIIDFLKKTFAEGYKELCSEKNKKNLRKWPTPPWSNETNRDDEETGNVLFNCKSPAEYKDGRLKPRPLLCDARGAPMSEEIGGGSLLNVAVAPYVWYNDSLGAGLRLTLTGVQVLDLKHGGRENTMNSCGFEAQEGFETTSAMLADASPTHVDDANTEWCQTTPDTLPKDAAMDADEF
jgi:hypothetical protein